VTQDVRDGPRTAGADCHIHVFGDAARYHPIAERTYTPRAANLPEWHAVSAPHGIERAVLVQPSAYGTDNSRMLEELREGGDMLRGVAVIEAGTADDALDAMDALGVRGVRLNLATGVPPDLGAVPDLVRSTSARIARLGWHLQVLARGVLLESIASIVPVLDVPVVFDHMASAALPSGSPQPGFDAVFRLFGEGKCWIKISGADHVATRRDAPEEALPVMRGLVAANADRLVWGSDWPHIGKNSGPDGVDYLPIDHGGLLELLRAAAGPAYDRILVDNPSELYGWH
jgi:predicted TIM-barrel fold metal-dependent hydrolase